METLSCIWWVEHVAQHHIPALCATSSPCALPCASHIASLLMGRLWNHRCCLCRQAWRACVSVVKTNAAAAVATLDEKRQFYFSLQRPEANGWIINWWILNTLMDALSRLSAHIRPFVRGGLMKEQQWPHARSEQRLASVSFNMDVCSGFMAAVVTGRYKTSGHLTSLGDQSGGGGRSSESWAILLRILSEPPWAEEDGRVDAVAALLV